MWLGYGHATTAQPGSVTTYEAESGVVSGFARVVPCDVCSGGAKVTNIGNDFGNDVTLTVDAPRRGDYLLTLVGAVAGTRTFSVSVSGAPPVPVTITGSSFVDPLLARSIPVRLRRHGNTIKIFNTMSYAPDLDKITLTALR